MANSDTYTFASTDFSDCENKPAYFDKSFSTPSIHSPTVLISFANSGQISSSEVSLALMLNDAVASLLFGGSRVSKQQSYISRQTPTVRDSIRKSWLAMSYYQSQWESTYNMVTWKPLFYISGHPELLASEFNSQLKSISRRRLETGICFQTSNGDFGDISLSQLEFQIRVLE